MTVKQYQVVKALDSISKLKAGHLIISKGDATRFCELAMEEGVYLIEEEAEAIWVWYQLAIGSREIMDRRNVRRSLNKLVEHYYFEEEKGRGTEETNTN